MLLVPQAGSAGEQSPKLLVTVPVLAPYVDALTHGIGQVQSLLRPGQDPHSFALSPSQAQMLDSAQILIVPDLSMNPMLARLLAKNPRLHVIELSKLEGADPLPYATENPWISAVKTAGQEKDDDDQDKKDKSDKKPSTSKKPTTDPHLWLDPERMAALAKPLAEAIAETTPGNRSALLINADNLATHLRQDVIPAMKILLTPREKPFRLANKTLVPFITYHAAYQYFLARFGIADHGQMVVRPEDYMGAKSLDTLLTTAKTIDITCVIAESDTSLVKRIATLSNAKIVILSPEQNIERSEVPSFTWMQNDYDRFLYKTAKTFGDCL